MAGEGGGGRWTSRHPTAHSEDFRAQVPARGVFQGHPSPLPQSISQSHSLSQSQMRATPPRSPKSPQGRALAELARRQLADMTMQVAELKEMLEEERARANMLATQTEVQVESARGTPTPGPLTGAPGGQHFRCSAVRAPTPWNHRLP